MKHYPNHLVIDCQRAIVELVEDYKEKYPLREFRAAKCNKPSVWFKKYKFNKWDQVKDKE